MICINFNSVDRVQIDTYNYIPACRLVSPVRFLRVAAAFLAAISIMSTFLCQFLSVVSSSYISFCKM